MQLKMSSGKWRPFCLGLNVLKTKTLKWTSTQGQVVHLRLQTPEGESAAKQGRPLDHS